jgi:hypothetical protein
MKFIINLLTKRHSAYLHLRFQLLLPSQKRVILSISKANNFLTSYQTNYHILLNNYTNSKNRICWISVACPRGYRRVQVILWAYLTWANPTKGLTGTIRIEDLTYFWISWEILSKKVRTKVILKKWEWQTNNQEVFFRRISSKGIKYDCVL